MFTVAAGVIPGYTTELSKGHTARARASAAPGGCEPAAMSHPCFKGGFREAVTVKESPRHLGGRRGPRGLLCGAELPGRRPGGHPGRPGAQEDREPVHFKKDGGTWKIDMTQVRGLDQMDKFKAFAPKMAKAMTELADEIKDNKYKTVADAQRAMSEKMKALVQE